MSGWFCGRDEGFGGFLADGVTDGCGTEVESRLIETYRKHQQHIEPNGRCHGPLLFIWRKAPSG